MSALPQGADVYPNAGRGRNSGQDTIVGILQGWKLTGAIKTAERKLADRTLVHGGQALNGMGGGQCPSGAKGQRHPCHGANLWVGQNRPAEGRVQGPRDPLTVFGES
jgi:hypothetical protein